MSSKIDRIYQDNFLEKSQMAVISLAIFLTSILFSSSYFFFFTTIKYVFLAFAGSVSFLLLGMYLLRTKFVLNKKLKIILCIPVVMVIWFFISALMGVDFLSSFWSDFSRHTGFLTYFFSLILFISSLFVFNKENFHIPLKAFVFGGTLAAVSVYLSPLLLNVDLLILKNSNNGGTFGNTTYAGIFLIFSLFSAGLLFFKEKTVSKKWIWVICSVLIFLSPIFVNTKNIFTGNIVGISSFVGDARAGLVSIFIGLFFSIILYFYFSNKKAYSVLSKVMLAVVFIVSIYMAINVLSENSKLHKFIVSEGGGTRFIYWEMAQIGIEEKPIFGFGLENFYKIHKKYFNPVLLSPEYPEEPWADKPHNNILEIAFSTGLPGLALYLLFIGSILLALVRKAGTVDAKERVVPALLFGLFTSYLFQDFFAFDTVSSLQAFFVAAAVVFVYCFGGPESKSKRELNKYLSSIILVLIVCSSLAMIYFFSFKIRQESIMMRKINQMSIYDRIPVFASTMNISPVGGLKTESQYIDQVVLNYKMKWSTFDADVRMALKDELESFFEYSKNKSDQYPEDFRFALLSSRIGNMIFDISKAKEFSLLDTSQKYGLRAIDNSPTSPLGYQVLAENFFLKGRLDTAMKFAEMIVGLNERAGKFYDLVIYIAKATKNPKLINEKIAEAEKAIPGYEYKLK